MPNPSSHCPPPPRSRHRIHVPNTRSVLYEQLQKLETFIRERRHKKARTLVATAAVFGGGGGHKLARAHL